MNSLFNSADKLKLRCYSYIDNMQPQFAAFCGSVAKGDPPLAGMASLYLETAPGNGVVSILDAVLKTTNVRPGLVEIEREFGVFEVHSFSQSEVLWAGDVALDLIELRVEDRIQPRFASEQLINNVTPYQAQIMNRDFSGMMLIPGDSVLVLEVEPAAYIGFIANEIEKAAEISLCQVSVVGAFGRLWVSGREAEINVAHQAAKRTLGSIISEKKD